MPPLAPPWIRHCHCITQRVELLLLTIGDDEDSFDPIELTGKQLEERIIIAISSGGQHTALLVKSASQLD